MLPSGAYMSPQPAAVQHRELVLSGTEPRQPSNEMLSRPPSAAAAAWTHYSMASAAASSPKRKHKHSSFDPELGERRPVAVSDIVME
nr:hypothetical protein CFP56_22476 [Quercus suber]